MEVQEAMAGNRTKIQLRTEGDRMVRTLKIWFEEEENKRRKGRN
jgi:hypothetical protein